MTKIAKLLKTDQTIFSVQDLRLVWGESNHNNLLKAIQYYVEKGEIVRVRNGLFHLANTEFDVKELGNKLRTPSYISFETVLFSEGVIFQWGKSISLAAQNSEEVEIGELRFKFRKLKDEVLLNKQGIELKENLAIATLERAFLDMIYVNSEFYFDNLRGLNFSVCRNLVPLYNNKRMLKTLDKWEEYAKSQ